MFRNPEKLLIGTLITVLVALSVVSIAIFRTAEWAVFGDAQETLYPDVVTLEIQEGYTQFWDAWVEANENLDPASLRDSLDGDALAQAESILFRLVRMRRPVAIEVKHDYDIVRIDDETASILDRIVGKAVLLDPRSEDPTGDEEDGHYEMKFTLVKKGDRWVIVELQGLEMLL